MLDGLPDIDLVTDDVNKVKYNKLSAKHAIFHFMWKDELPHDPDRYKLDSRPEGLRQVDILYHLSRVPPTTVTPNLVDSEDGVTAGQDRISLFRITQLPISPAETSQKKK